MNKAWNNLRQNKWALLQAIILLTIPFGVFFYSYPLLVSKSKRPYFVSKPEQTIETVVERCSYRRGSLVHHTHYYNCERRYLVETGIAADQIVDEKTGAIRLVNYRKIKLKTLIR